MRIKQILAVAVAGGILIAAACSKSPGTTSNNSLFGNYDQTTMLNNIGTNVLQANINTTTTNAALAVNAISNFTTSPTSSNLTAAQAAWSTLVANWALIEPFSFGPLNDNLISANVDTWPASATKIEAAINAQSNAANVGADTKGLKGLEYLLFDKNGNNAVLAKYKSAAGANRAAFLNSVAQDIAKQTTILKAAWGGTYLNSFVSAKGNDVSSSVSQLVNAISLSLDQVKNLKVGNPIGMGVKVNDNAAHPDLVEYTIAEESLPVMKANIQAMKAAFDGGSAQGLDDLLNYVKAQKNGQNLSNVVDAQFDDVIGKINAITPPYATAVTAQKAQIQAIFASVKTLIAYFKVDVANNLGVTITFADTDGD